MDTISRHRDLRVCPECWSTVHRDELAEHDEWHERIRSEAVVAARRSLVGS